MPDLDRLLGSIAARAQADADLAPPARIRRLATRRRRRNAVAAGLAGAAVAVGAITIGPQLRGLAHRDSAPATPVDRSIAELTKPAVGGDYRDFLRVNGVTYLSTAQFETNPSYAGAHLAVVRRADSSPLAAGEAEAAFLPVGAEVVAFQGYRSAFRVLARSPQGWKVYEAPPAADARTGADVLDIAGRVAQIDVLSYDSAGSALIGSVTDASTVNAVVADLMGSAASSTSGGDPAWIVAFVMTDGTRVIRDYDAAAHRLGSVVVPQSMSDAIAAVTH
ncbi:MAG: hypothetical protein QOI42_2117 [Frankiaceae bacterium]|nr:hypothetical protein [Frankiaceae bacterium]